MPSTNSRRNNNMLFQPNTNHTTNHISQWTPPQPELSTHALERLAFKERQYQERCLSYEHSCRGEAITFSRGNKGSGRADGRPRTEPKVEARFAEKRLKRGEDPGLRLKRKQKPNLKLDDVDDMGYVEEEPRARMEVDIMELVRPAIRTRRSKGFDPVRRPHTIPDLLLSGDLRDGFIPETPSLTPVITDDDQDAEWDDAGHTEFSFDMFPEAEQREAMETKERWTEPWYRFLVPLTVQ